MPFPTGVSHHPPGAGLQLRDSQQGGEGRADLGTFLCRRIEFVGNWHLR
jgi:hypothetical protein